jgi:hypothetical protein
LPATIKFLILVLGEQMQFSWCRLMDNTVIVGAEMEATPVGAPARIVTVGSRQTRPSISPSLEKSLSGFGHQPLCVLWDCGFGTVFSDTTPPIYAGP